MNYNTLCMTADEWLGDIADHPKSTMDHVLLGVAYFVKDAMSQEAMAILLKKRPDYVRDLKKDLLKWKFVELSQIRNGRFQKIQATPVPRDGYRIVTGPEINEIISKMTPVPTDGYGQNEERFDEISSGEMAPENADLTPVRHPSDTRPTPVPTDGYSDCIYKNARTPGIIKHSYEVRTSLATNTENLTTIGTANASPNQKVSSSVLEETPIDGELFGPNEKLPTDKQKAKSDRGTRLPESWSLPDDWREYAKTNRGWSNAEVSVCAEMFADYWIGATGAKATKRDWKRTWRNWVRQQNQKTIEQNAVRRSSANQSMGGGKHAPMWFEGMEPASIRALPVEFFDDLWDQIAPNGTLVFEYHSHNLGHPNSIWPAEVIKRREMHRKPEYWHTEELRKMFIRKYVEAT